MAYANHTAARVSFAALPQTVQPVGIATSVAFGSPLIQIHRYVSPTGITSSVAFGSPYILNIAPIQPSGIASSQAFGTPHVKQAQFVQPTGIASSQAFGEPTILARWFLYPVGIPSNQAFGVPFIKIAQFVNPVGIDSSQIFGAPTVITRQIVEPAGISSSQAFGTPQVITRQFVQPVGISSSQVFGIPGIAGGLVAEPDNTVDLLCMPSDEGRFLYQLVNNKLIQIGYHANPDTDDHTAGSSIDGCKVFFSGRHIQRTDLALNHDAEKRDGDFPGRMYVKGGSLIVNGMNIGTPVADFDVQSFQPQTLPAFYDKETLEFQRYFTFSPTGSERNQAYIRTTMPFNMDRCVRTSVSSVVVSSVRTSVPVNHRGVRTTMTFVTVDYVRSSFPFIFSLNDHEKTLKDNFVLSSVSVNARPDCVRSSMPVAVSNPATSYVKTTVSMINTEAHAEFTTFVSLSADGHTFQTVDSYISEYYMKLQIKPAKNSNYYLGFLQALEQPVDNQSRNVYAFNAIFLMVLDDQGHIISQTSIRNMEAPLLTKTDLLAHGMHIPTGLTGGTQLFGTAGNPLDYLDMIDIDQIVCLYNQYDGLPEVLTYNRGMHCIGIQHCFDYTWSLLPGYVQMSRSSNKFIAPIGPFVAPNENNNAYFSTTPDHLGVFDYNGKLLAVIDPSDQDIFLTTSVQDGLKYPNTSWLRMFSGAACFDTTTLSSYVKSTMNSFISRAMSYLKCKMFATENQCKIVKASPAIAIDAEDAIRAKIAVLSPEDQAPYHMTTKIAAMAYPIDSEAICSKFDLESYVSDIECITIDNILKRTTPYDQNPMIAPDFWSWERMQWMRFFNYDFNGYGEWFTDGHGGTTTNQFASPDYWNPVLRVTCVSDRIITDKGVAFIICEATPSTRVTTSVAWYNRPWVQHYYLLRYDLFGNVLSKNEIASVLEPTINGIAMPYIGKVLFMQSQQLFYLIFANGYTILENNVIAGWTGQFFANDDGIIALDADGIVFNVLTLGDDTLSQFFGLPQSPKAYMHSIDVAALPSGLGNVQAIYQYWLDPNVLSDGNNLILYFTYRGLPYKKSFFFIVDSSLSRATEIPVETTETGADYVFMLCAANGKTIVLHSGNTERMRHFALIDYVTGEHVGTIDLGVEDVHLNLTGNTGTVKNITVDRYGNYITLFYADFHHRSLQINDGRTGELLQRWTWGASYAFGDTEFDTGNVQCPYQLLTFPQHVNTSIPVAEDDTDLNLSPIDAYVEYDLGEVQVYA